MRRKREPHIRQTIAVLTSDTQKLYRDAKARTDETTIIGRGYPNGKVTQKSKHHALDVHAAAAAAAVANQRQSNPEQKLPNGRHAQQALNASGKNRKLSTKALHRD